MGKVIGIVLVLALLLSCAGLTACGDSEQASNDSEGNNSASSSDQNSQDDSNTSSATSGQFTWDDMPVYPGAETDVDALDVGGSGEDQRMEWRHYKTSDSLDEVASYYKTEMPKNGWQQVQWMDIGMTEASWTCEEGMYYKNDWHDQGTITLVDRGEGEVFITLLRVSDM